MKFGLITEALNDKNVSKVKLLTLNGKEILISKQDMLEKNGESIIIKRTDGKEAIILFDEISEITPIKRPKKPQIKSFERSGQKNRH